MPLESATYIPDLVTSNPAHSDGLNNADAHLRLIKGALKATFPNFTDVALASTQTQLDATVATVGTTGVSVLADAGVGFKTNTTDGLKNPSAGTVAVNTGGTQATSFNASGISTSLVLASAGFSGPGATPIGAMVMWLSDTLPSGSGVWAWANGQAVSRTTYATLYGILGTTYGVGDGSTTFNLPNMQEVVPVGKSTMGGASSPGLLASISSGLKAVLGKLFGGDTVTLGTANLPPHNHAVFLKDPGHTHTTNALNQVFGVQQVGGAIGGNGTATINSATTGMTIGSVSGTANDNQTAAGPGTSTPINNVQPTMTVNFIIRIA